MEAVVLVTELQRTSWLRVVGRDRSFQRFGMSDNGSEVLDADHDVNTFLHVEVFKVCRMNADGSLQWLLKYD